MTCPGGRLTPIKSRNNDPNITIEVSIDKNMTDLGLHTKVTRLSFEPPGLPFRLLRPGGPAPGENGNKHRALTNSGKRAKTFGQRPLLGDPHRSPLRRCL
ncbi:unnamed protein product [Cuscuta epithymum]|uniref:Uncharacterized protein n=1 Tax=Cuscuta epithymum TaxID=186058 RepID=A0AAV0CQJ1_9ASTE|nr:unnamed protein product [Cuscuta epithymum]